jgi:transposase-like protein
MRKLRQLQALARRSYWQESDARRIVDAWRRSGETVSRFAGELGLDPRRVSRWAARLDDGTSDVGFVPVRVAEAPRESRGPIEIELAPGQYLRVPPGFAADDLRRVLAVLEERTPC